MSAVAAQLRVPFAFRLGNASRTAVYVVLSIALGVLHVLLMLPLLALRSEDVWRLADHERKLANRFLRAHIPPLPEVRVQLDYSDDQIQIRSSSRIDLST